MLQFVDVIQIPYLSLKGYSYHMNFDKSNSIGGHLESIYIVEL